MQEGFAHEGRVCVRRFGACRGTCLPAEPTQFVQRCVKGRGTICRLAHPAGGSSDATGSGPGVCPPDARRLAALAGPLRRRRSYVVKFQNNPQHARVLANEMLASRLAQLVGLPVAAPAFVEVSRSLIGSNPQLAFDVGERREPIRPGIQFGSRFPGVPSQTLVVDFLPDRLLRRVKDLTSAFLGAFVFDKWTCNCDGRQVIFHRPADDEGSSYSVAMIDQGFCFNDGDWTFPDSPIRGLYPRRLVYEKVTGMESFEPFLSRIENLTAGELEECARESPRTGANRIPANWRG